MKYIRTKDNCITEGNFEIGKTIATLFGDEQITKENTADTIEELCDEFVIVGTNWQQIIDLESAKHNMKIPYDLKVYGAIWTDKGLIYVAKFNDKGEMELL